MRRWIGWWLVGVGGVHTALGLLFLARPLGDMIQAGLWNSLGKSPLRNFAFWFFLAGLLIALVGLLTDWIEVRTGGMVPRVLGWTLLLLLVLGVIVMPISGFWLLAPAVVGSFRRVVTSHQSLSVLPHLPR
jgi:hypothetical protein